MLYDFMIYNLHQFFCNLQTMFTPFRKKTVETKVIKNIFNKNERRFRDVKTENHANNVGRLTYDPKLNKPLPVQFFVFSFITV